MRTTPFPFTKIIKVVALVSCLLFLVCGSLLTPGESAGVSNNSATSPMQSGPEVVGQWSSVITLPIVAIHMHMLPNGKVLIWQDDNNANYNTNGTRLAGYTVAYVWDVGAGTTTQVDNTTVNEFCSGHDFLPDGRLLIVTGAAPSNFPGMTLTFSTSLITGSLVK